MYNETTVGVNTMQKFKTAEQVTETLKATVKRIETNLSKVRKEYRSYGIQIPYAELNYRTAFGPYKVRDGEFRTERFWFCPVAMKATSYGWWSMLRIINGKLVRNTCDYSMQTAKHQSTLDKALKALGIVPDLEVHTKANIGDLDSWKYRILSDWSDACIWLKYTRKNRKESKTWRAKFVARETRELTKLEKAGIGLRFTKADKAKALEGAESRRRSKLETLKKRREWAKERLERSQKQVVNASPVVERTVSHLSVVK